MTRYMNTCSCKQTAIELVIALFSPSFLVTLSHGGSAGEFLDNIVGLAVSDQTLSLVVVGNVVPMIATG